MPNLSLTVNYKHDNIMLLTSFMKPALSDFINFIHDERCVSERVRNRRSGRETVDFSLGPFKSQIHLSNLHLLNETSSTKKIRPSSNK